MKKIFTIALILTAFASAQAQTNTTAANTDKKAAQTGKTTPASSTKDATAAKEDNLSKYVGTNDANIALVREGVRKG